MQQASLVLAKITAMAAAVALIGLCLCQQCITEEGQLLGSRLVHQVPTHCVTQAPEVEHSTS
jgi:anthranilate/para-aminobenzoate synthase component II